MGGGRYLKQGLWPATVCWSLSCHSIHSSVCVLETRSPGCRACLPLIEAVWLSCGSGTAAAASVANTVSPPNLCRSPRMDRRGTAYEGAAALAAARCCPCLSARACGATSTATCLTRACTLCGRVGGNWVRLGVCVRCGPPPSSKTWRTFWGPMECRYRSPSPSRLGWGTGKGHRGSPALKSGSFTNGD